MSKDDEIRLVIIEDHPLMRLGIATMLASQPDISVVGEASSGSQAVQVCKAKRPTIVLVDLSLPDMSGVDVIRAVKLFLPDTHFVVLTTYERDEDIYQALAAGALGYVVKGLPHQVLIDAIRRAHSGSGYLSESVEERLTVRATSSMLSAQELRVLRLMKEGKSNREIGVDLGITESTIKFHVSEILVKLGAKDRTHAVVIAIRRGIVHP